MAYVKASMELGLKVCPYLEVSSFQRGVCSTGFNGVGT